MRHKISTILFVLLFLFAGELWAADSLYSRAYGNVKDPAVIFLHGGPGYNAISFELSSAQRLADSGFYVIVFDQRACGRSARMKGTYKLDEALDDIHTIYHRHGVKRASLIGHSWGGTLGIFFADRYAAYVDKLILTGSPLSYPRGFRTMLAKAIHFYQSRDSVQYRLVNALQNADTSSLMYSSMLFQHAAAIGLYSPSVVSEESKLLKKRIMADTLARFMRDMTQAPVLGFYKTLKYTTLDMTEPLRRVATTTPVRAIYGEEDGLFDQYHLDDLFDVIKSPIAYIANASHNVFLDQPTSFMSVLVKILRDKE